MNICLAQNTLDLYFRALVRSGCDQIYLVFSPAAHGAAMYRGISFWEPRIVKGNCCLIRGMSPDSRPLPLVPPGWSILL